MNVTILKEDESWQQFVKNMGDVANLEYIQPLEKKIARECGGLTLAITVIGSSMRGKTRVDLWKDALDSLRSCFLYCLLYPVAILLDDLIYFWWAEGILGEHATYKQAYNRGSKLVESLKDACLLEADEIEIVDCVKMYDVVRDVFIWIASTSGDEHTSIFQVGIGLTEISQFKISASVN
ncbi:hypothetical protein BC332_20801 [Capsicum chinense]|nr:hypothetical protein BC332_20801 [Capsicum chinense]